MKTILLFSSLVVVLLQANQPFPRIYDNDPKHIAELKKFHHTWSLDKEVTLNNNLFNPQEFSNYDSISIPKQYFTTGCNVPGYTGPHCEFPICDMPSRPDFNHNAENVVIDFAVYPTCNQTMPLYIDDHMYEFSIEVQTLGSYNPFATLYNATGYPVVPTNFDTSDPNRLILVYDRQPAGIYQVYPQSDVPTTGCYVQVSGVSQMDIHVGFIQYTGNNRDPERSDFPQRNIFLNTLNLITAHPHNLMSPGSIAAITMYQSYNMLTHPQPMNLRYGCSYEYYLNAIHCSQTGDYYAKIDGYDFFGNSFRRVIGFKCEVNPYPPATTTTTASPPVTACKNNGTLINSGTTSYCYCKNLFTGNDCSQTICLNGGTAIGNGLCMCQVGFTGSQCQDVRCTDDSGFTFPKDYPVPVFVIRARSQLKSIVSQINTQLSNLAVKFQSDRLAFQNFVCYNGGTPRRDFCDCVAGFEGTFCEFSTCIDTNPENDFGASNKSMIFVLDVTNNNAQVLGQLQTYMTTMLRDIASTGRRWISEFSVLGYDQTKTYHLGSGGRRDIDVIATAFSKAYNLSLANSPSCIPVRVWETVETATHLSTNYGYIFNFQSTPPLETVPELITRASDNIAAKGIQFNSFIASVGKNAFTCNSNSNTFKNIKLSCEGSEGDAFDISPSNFQYILRIIPTFYSSGVVYKKVMNDCTSGCYLYYPIDSHTQNAQIFINGAPGNISQQIFMPNLTALANVPFLLQDTTTGWNIIEMRRACPSGWNDLGSQYCYTTVSTPMTWTDAQAYCQSNNGFLIDDMSPIKNSFLTSQGVSPFWIGLNDIQTLGTFQWDRGVLEPHTLSSTDYTNWALGVNLTDPTKRCAYMTDAWYIDACTSKKQFMCQSHKFMDSFDPNPSEERTLPPGKWSAIITNPGKTVVQVKSQSRIQIVTGYSTYIHDDYPQPNPQAGTSQNMMLAHITTTGSITRDTALANTQIYDFYNGTMYAAANFQLRLKCAYQFVSQPFACPNSQAVNNAFTALSVGYDEYGFTFQRMKSGHCVNSIQTCSNGGVLYDGLCVCGEYWTGQLCDQPVCVNNGTLSDDKKSCICKVGYEGVACEREVCTTNSPDSTNQYGKSFVLVIENTSFNVKAIKQIQSTLPGILTSAKYGWFTQYVLVVVDSSNKPYLKISTNINDFKSALIDVIPSDATTSCNIPLFNAMIMGLHQVNAAKSIFYTVARSMPSDLNLEVEFATLVAQKQPQFYYHAITGDSGCNVDFTDSLTSQKQPQFYYHAITGDSGCNVDFTDSLTSRIQQYSIATAGNFLATTGATAGSLMSVYIPPLFASGVLRNPTLKSGTSVTDIFITVYSSYQSASVISPTGQIEVLKVVYKDTNITSGAKLYVYQIQAVAEFGIYTLSLNGVGACYAQVRSTGGAEIYVGYVVSKVVNDNARITYAEIYDQSTNEFQYVKFYRRSNCTHNWYSDPFKCGKGTLLIKYFGLDISGQTFTRDAFTLCLQYGIPTPTSPYTTTTSGVTQVGTTTTTGIPQPGTTTTTSSPSNLNTVAGNVYLILDTSSAVPSSSYSTIFSNFIASIFVQYTISPSFINVALSGSPGDGNLWLTNPTFNTFTSLGMLKSVANGTYYPVDGPQTSGQSQLSVVLNQATNSNFLNTGYKSGIIPHLIIYLTTSSTPNTDAINVGQTIIKSNTFQIISIAYGSNLGNINSLTSMSSCVYNPLSVNDLNTLATTLSGKIGNAASRNGVYAC
uniref:EGF-like domain-containing protein n=1 Tax=Strongyloides papillosus TaxID=174720 RepID=A0A0N5BCG1_STREA